MGGVFLNTIFSVFLFTRLFGLFWFALGSRNLISRCRFDNRGVIADIGRGKGRRRMQGLLDMDALLLLLLVFFLLYMFLMFFKRVEEGIEYFLVAILLFLLQTIRGGRGLLVVSGGHGERYSTKRKGVDELLLIDFAANWMNPLHLL